MKDEGGIIISEKYGVNPSLEVCALCGKEMGIIMFGKLKDDVEAPKQVCIGHLCEDCTSRLKKEEKRVFMEISDYGFTGRYYIFPDYSITPSELKNFGDNVVIYLSDKSFRDLEQNIKELEE